MITPAPLDAARWFEGDSAAAAATFSFASSAVGPPVFSLPPAATRELPGGLAHRDQHQRGPGGGRRDRDPGAGRGHHHRASRLSAAATGADLQGRADAAEGCATDNRNVSGVPPAGSGGADVLERHTCGGDGALMLSLLELEDASLAGEEGRGKW